LEHRRERFSESGIHGRLLRFSYLTVMPVPWHRSASYLQICTKNRVPTSVLEPLTPAPVTSLLAYVLACPSVSGNCACLGGFRWSGGIALSTVYRCVLARLQYGLQYMRGRDEVMWQWSIHDPVYRSDTTTCRGLSSSVDALRIGPHGFEVVF
jgi:hypothetical protein